MIKTFGKKKLVRDISANTLQMLITQVFGLVIFYMTSKYLVKTDFGEFNWSMAVGSTILAVASLGLDLVFVRRVAIGQNVVQISGIHFFHTLVVALIFCSIAFIFKQFVPAFTDNHPFFFFVFLNLALANMANSFKLCLNGLESYRQLALLALCANVFKFAIIVALWVMSTFTILNVIFAYMAASLLEFVLAYLMMNRKLSTKIKPLLKITEYKYFILESLPQLGVVLFDSALARIDWILLGILSTAMATAEYSFVYKIFELSRLPILIISPILLTRFSKLFSPGATIAKSSIDEIQFFLKLEMFVVMFIPIVFICTWTPLIDYFTNNKYGAVNELNYWILASCVPLHGIISFLWTLGFVQGQLKTILYITIAVSLLNMIANALFIPLYNATGSAVSFLICTVMQLLLYLKFINQTRVKLMFKNVLISIAGATLAILSAKALTGNIFLAAAIAITIHIIFTFISKQLTLSELKQKMHRQP